jgi:hypothetical protein
LAPPAHVDPTVMAQLAALPVRRDLPQLACCNIFNQTNRWIPI